ncbi:hypothetical protein TeGR_g10722, partial [Tetraparma gracilis]
MMQYGGSELYGIGVLDETYIVVDKDDKKIYECPLTSVGIPKYDCEVFADQPHGTFWDPFNMLVDPIKRLVFVVDYLNSDVLVFDFDGQFLSPLASSRGALIQPRAMAQRPGLYAPLSPSHPPSSLHAAGERIEVALAMMDAYNSTVSNSHPTSAHDLALEVSATGYITGTNFTTTIEGEILYDKNSPAHASLTASVVIPYSFSVTGDLACPPGFTPVDNACMRCANGFVKLEATSAPCTACVSFVAGSVDTDPVRTPDSADSCICSTGFVLFERECVECPEGTECAAPGVNVLTLPLEVGYWRASNESMEVLQCGEVEACTPVVCEDRNEEIEEETGGAVEDCSYYEVWCEDDSPMVNSATYPYPEGWLATHCAKTCGLCEEGGGGGEMCAENHVGPLCELCEDGYAAMQGTCVECEGGGSAAALAGVFVVLALTAALAAWFVRRNGAKVKKWTHGSGMAAVKAVLAYSQILGSLSVTMLVDFGPAFSGLTQLLAASNLDFVSFLPLDCVAPMDHHARLLGYTLGMLVLDAVLLLAHKAAGRGKGGQVLMALFLVNSFLLPQVSMVIFSTFPCTQFDGDYGTYLTADKSIDCDGAAHAGMVAIALTGGLRLLDGGSGLQFAVGLLICFFGLRTVAVKKPYLTHGTNRFAEIVGWQLVLTFVGAQVVSISDGDKTDSAVDA